MEFFIKLTDDWVKVTPKSKEKVFTKEEILSLIETAGYDLNYVDWNFDNDGIDWFCTYCGNAIGHLNF